MKTITTILIFLLTTISVGQEIKFGKISKAVLEEKSYSKDSIAEAAYLYRYRRTHYTFNQNSGFEVVTEVHNRLKIYNKEGFEKANIFIDYYKPDSGASETVTSIKGYTHNLENGKINSVKLSKKDIFNEKSNKYYSTKKITMPALKEGSVVEWKYKLRSPYYTVIDDLEFQHDIPVKKLYYEVEIPEYFSFNKLSKGYYAITPVTGAISRTIRMISKSRSGVGTSFSSGNIEYKANMLTFDASDIPSLKGREPFINNIDNYKGGMKFELTAIKYPNEVPKFYNSSWEDVTKNIYKSEFFGGQLEKTFFKNDLEVLLAGKQTKSQKLTTIFQFVKSKIKWNGYLGKYVDASLKRAYKEGSGNSASINLLLTSMLREAGFDANPVLISTRSNGVPLFPTSKGFNYVICMVSVSGGNILLDATEQYCGVNMLPPRAVNWNGRVVKKDGSSFWVSLVPGKHRLEENHMSVKLSEEGIIEGMIRTRLTGLNAYTHRKINNGLKEEGVISKLEDKYSIEIDNFKTTNDKNVFKPFVRSITFSSEDLAEEIGGKLYISPLLFFTVKTNPFKLENRKYPVDFTGPWKDKNSITLEIPQGFEVVSLPETLAIGLPDDLGVFKFQVKQTGNKITTVSILQLNEGVIVPQYYQQLKEFYKQIVEKQAEKIVITKS